ncbi:energy-coupling factor ABC transporter ATP-binding protein [Pararhizobium haloflavum]|uniref:energy-coupling factor ABC transporter ATP-binding protein n=1 Tax=Pararhizobium haloflavum TaxID=2037914 RepID=UPI000C1A36DD|nr:ABC transporter ATP-binding protein [Pararhizobium haloflavum]
MIRLAGVSHQFDERPVLEDLDLALSERRIGVVGANGSGKSTFARLLNGLIVPSLGTVTVDGLDTADHGKAVRRKVGFIFQNPDNQIVYPIVKEDIAFGLKRLDLPRAEKEARIASVLTRFGLDGLSERSTQTLSGGQKQLLAIAGVMIMEPEVIVFDEPTTLLDLRNRNHVAQVIAGLDQPVITVSHDLDLVRDYDRVLVFDEGRILADDVPGPALARYVAAMS